MLRFKLGVHGAHIYENYAFTVETCQILKCHPYLAHALTLPAKTYFCVPLNVKILKLQTLDLNDMCWQNSPR